MINFFEFLDRFVWKLAYPILFISLVGMSWCMYLSLGEKADKMLQMKESQIHHEANAAYYKTRMIECLEEAYDND